MKTYRISLKVHSAVLTPFQADTIFGHLCWVVAHQDGQKGIDEFIQPFREKNPPFVISDGFPGDLLPKPMSVEFGIDDPLERKATKGIDFLSVDEFESIRKGEKVTPRIPDGLPVTSVASHNVISRITHATPMEGGVYAFEETFVPDVTIYLKAISEAWRDRVAELLKELSKVGYGKRKSIGKGQFLVREVVKFDFAEIEKANGFVSLCGYCPAEDDPTEGFYRTFVKYGKLGEEFTFCGNPFKRPLLMIRTGSVFETSGEPKEFYGRIVQDGIAPAKREAIQYGYAFALPVNINDSAIFGHKGT